jgi:hypothetical protein
LPRCVGYGRRWRRGPGIADAEVEHETPGRYLCGALDFIFIEGSFRQPDGRDCPIADKDVKRVGRQAAVLSVRFRGASWRGEAPPHMAPVHFTERPSKSGCKPFLLSFLLCALGYDWTARGTTLGRCHKGRPTRCCQAARPPQAASHDEGPRRRPPSAVLSGLDVVISLHPALPGVELSRVSARLRLHLR